MMEDPKSANRRSKRDWETAKFINKPSSLVLSVVVWSFAVSVAGVLISSPFVQVNRRVKSQGEVTSELGVRGLPTARAGTFHRVVQENASVGEGELIGFIETKGFNKEVLDTVIKSLTSIVRNDVVDASLISMDIEAIRQIVAKSQWAFKEADVGLPIVEVLNLYDGLIQREASFRKATLGEVAPLKRSQATLDAKISRLKRVKKKKDLEYFIEGLEDERQKLASQIAQLENAYRLKRNDSVREFQDSAKRALVRVNLFLAGAEVRSPIKGSLYHWLVPDRSQISVGTNVAEIFPSTSKVIAKLRVRSNDQPKMVVGQSAYMKLESFPYQRFGIFHGEVTDVKSVADQTGVYIVTATIEPTARVPASALPIGSAVNADIIIGTESLFSIGMEKVRGDWR